MRRRKFLIHSVTIPAGALLAILLEGCRGDDNSVGCGGTAGAISTNHGHSVCLTDAQITAGDAVTLTLSSGSGHTHTVSLTAEELTTLTNGETVQQTSTSDAGHTHSVTFTQDDQSGSTSDPGPSPYSATSH
jgi:plastocyanin